MNEEVKPIEISEEVKYAGITVEIKHTGVAEEVKHTEIAEEIKHTGATEEVKRMEIREFRELGFLQELNRQFLHPLGMALEVIIDEDGTESLGGIWDYRQDDEGIYFDLEHSFYDEEYRKLFLEKHKAVEEYSKNAKQKRLDKLGFIVEPVPPQYKSGEDKDNVNYHYLKEGK